MCGRLILATNNNHRKKAAIGCGLVDGWVQFPARATHFSVHCSVQSATVQTGNGGVLQPEYEYRFFISC